MIISTFIFLKLIKLILVAKRGKLSHGSGIAPEIVSYSTIEAC